MGNILKTLVLLGILSVIFVTIGGYVGGEQGLYIAFIFSLLMNGFAYFYSDKLALKMSGAKPLDPHKYRELHDMIKDLAHQMHLPMPKLYLIPEAQANAFATGRSPRHASVAVTAGILEVLSKDELRAVLAHEMGHVKNRDILVASVAAVLASAISFLANMAMWGGFSNNEENRGSGPLMIVVALLVPIAASIIQLAISRTREFGADETGARTIGDGEPLAQALLAIHDTTRRAPMRTNPAFSSLYIENPTGGLGGAMMKLFSTHPPVEERVLRLRKI